ncbi:MAG TPA: NADH-quinone oxidoreductase subunit C [Desulfobaccales bacterium]|nr:NADH-quinone oxidoreductase subunit C [Desulfobaccales bacterium]
MNKAVALLEEKFPDEIVEVVEFRGDTTIEVKPERIVDICTALKDGHDTGFKYLSMIAGMDYSPASLRFGVVYTLYSHKHHDRITLKTRLADDQSPAIDSVAKVWSTANWHEREIYDMMGICFKGHPDLRRILMPADWVGHPQRKDYPLKGM